MEQWAVLGDQEDPGAVAVGTSAHEDIVVSRSFHGAAHGRDGGGGDGVAVWRGLAHLHIV